MPFIFQLILYVIFLAILYFGTRAIIHAKPIKKKLQNMNENNYEFPEEVKELIANDPVLLAIRGTKPGYGVGLLSVNIIATTSRVIISTRKPTGNDITDIPYSQITSVEYKQAQFSACPITINNNIVVNSLNRDTPIEMVKLIHEKVSHLCGVSIALEHNKGFNSESWSFWAPRILATPVRSAASSEPITDQIKKLSELRDDGILTKEEFESKKSELLKRM
jgi:Short C-terminal domain/Bacterial PH domain